jgi:hypothetical protein
MKNAVITILVILLIAAVGFGVHFWTKSQLTPQPEEPTETQTELEPSIETEDPTDTQSREASRTTQPKTQKPDYTNEKYGYSMNLPEDYKAYTEKFDSAGAEAGDTIWVGQDSDMWTHGFYVRITEDLEGRIAEIEKNAFKVVGKDYTTIDGFKTTKVTVTWDIGYSVIHYFVETNSYVFEMQVVDINEKAIEVIESMTFSKEEKLALNKGTFAYDESLYAYHGDFDATGYITTMEMDESFCTENCQTFNYAFFNILEVTNELVETYVDEKAGNAFVGDMSIGIGCVADTGLLWRKNHSDEFGMQTKTHSVASSEKLLNATAENPVTINIKREPSTAGAGAPECYSHFTEVISIQ